MMSLEDEEKALDEDQPQVPCMMSLEDEKARRENAVEHGGRDWTGAPTD